MSIFILLFSLTSLLLVKLGLAVQWAKIPMSADLRSLSYVAATWSSNGDVFAAGQATSGRIIRSTDYGVTWTVVGSTTGQVYGISSRTISSGSTYFIAVDYQRYTYVSNSTGTLWRTITSRAANILYGVTIGSNGNAYQVGVNTARRSTSASNYDTWDTLTIGATGTWYDVSSWDGINVIVVGSSGKIYFSTNSGNAWTAANSGTTNAIYCINHASASFAMVAGSNGFLAKTSTGGTSWTTMTGFPTTYTARFHSISLLSEVVAYVAAYPSDGITAIGLIYYTNNGGSSWSQIYSTDVQLYSLSMYTESYGVAGAASGTGVFSIVAGININIIQIML
jgi:photosystem II stability/assembly factor-like uncharacterized protein